MTTTYIGMMTTYEARKLFGGKLHALFDKIEELNRPTPMNEQEYLEFSSMIKDLFSLSHGIRKDPLYRQLEMNNGRGEKKKTIKQQEKAENPKYQWCERCDTWLVKDWFGDHQETRKCRQIHNSKSVASRLCDREKEQAGKFAKKMNHKFYQVGQLLSVDLLQRKLPNDYDARVENFHQYRLPSPDEYR